jgi:hypothetical protein
METQTDYRALAHQQWPELKIHGSGPFCVLDYATMTATLFTYEMEARIGGKHVHVLQQPQRRAFRRKFFDVQD